MFDQASRYYPLKTAQFVAPDGQEHEYKLRRFLPSGPPASPPTRIVLQAHDRLDLLSARLLGNPLLFWWVCDASAAMDPFTLTGPEQAGRTVLVPTSPA